LVDLLVLLLLPVVAPYSPRDVRSPMEKGDVSDWKAMELLWEHTLKQEMHIDHLEDAPVSIPYNHSVIC